MSLALTLSPNKTINTIESDVCAGLSQLPYTFKRQDYEVDSITDTGGFATITLSAAEFDVSAEFFFGGIIYFGSDLLTGALIGTYTISAPPTFLAGQTVIETTTPFTVGTILDGYINDLNSAKGDFKVVIGIQDAAGGDLLDTSLRFSTALSGELFIDVAGLVSSLMVGEQSTLIYQLTYQEFFEGALQGAKITTADTLAIKSKRQRLQIGGSNMWDKLLVSGSTSAAQTFTTIASDADPTRLTILNASGLDSFSVGDVVALKSTDGMYNDIGVVISPVLATALIVELPSQAAFRGESGAGTVEAHLGSILTKFKNPLVWPGWKRTMSSIIDSNINTRTGATTTYFTTQAVDENKENPVTMLSPASGLGISIFTTPIIESQKSKSFVRAVAREQTNTEISKELFYQVLPECKNPIYVEWRNSLGEFDQHLFSVNQEVKNSSDKGELWAAPDTQDLEFSGSSIGRDVANTSQNITIGAEGLLIDQLEALREIKSSDFVYVYLRKDGSQRVKVRVLRGFETKHETKSRGQAFELSIILEMPKNFDLYATNQYKK